MTFRDALVEMLDGRRIRRAGWRPEEYAHLPERPRAGKVFVEEVVLDEWDRAVLVRGMIPPRGTHPIYLTGDDVDADDWEIDE